MKELKIRDEYNNKTFEDIKHIDENGVEFWYARELQIVLDYKEWRKFEGVIEKARLACQNSDINVFEHFVGTDKLLKHISQFKLENKKSVKKNTVHLQKMKKDFIKEI